MSEKRFEELLALFGGRSDAAIVLRSPSHICTQRMRVSKWKRYELFGVRATTGTPVKSAPIERPAEIVTSNGMRFRLRPAPKR